MLKNIAEITHGSYFVATNGDMLTKVFQELAKEHTGSIETKSINQTVSNEKWWILFLSLAFCSLAFWKNRFLVFE